MDFRGQPEILNAEDYGLSGTEPVINQECMLVHEKSGHYVKLSGTAMIDNITASNSHWRSATRSARECAKAYSLFYPDKSLRTFSLLTSGQSAGDMQTADRKNLNKEKETKL